MRDYLEIRFHGRGGGGTWTAAQITALSAMREGKYAQCFPLFGPERAGAPLEAYVRIGSERVSVHCMVYNPDIVVVLDRNLLPLSVGGLEENYILIVNSSGDLKESLEEIGLEKGKVFYVPASEIAMKVIGRPVVNTVMIGALVKVTGLFKLETAERVVKNLFGDKLGEELVKRNVEAMKEGFEKVREVA